MGSSPLQPGIPGACIVALDVLGGIFALNGGAFPGEMKTIWYFAPDTLDWENLEIGYTDFICWALTKQLGEFYADYRWPGWEHEVKVLTGDQGISFYPPLCT